MKYRLFQNFDSSSTGKILWIVFCFLAAGEAAYIAYLILYQMDLLQIDMAGHIASAKAFSEGFFHSFNDRFFLGFVHDLFYPPLEDALIGLSAIVFAKSNFILGYQIYLSFLATLYLAIVVWVSAGFRSMLSRAFFLGSFLFLFGLDKPGLLHFQGLSAMDLVVTGLSGETLGACFFFLLLREIYLRKNFRPWLVFCLCLFIVLSHIVVFCAASLIIILESCFRRDRRLLLLYGLALGCSAFYLVPFLAYRQFITSAIIFDQMPASLFGLTLLALLCLRGMSKEVTGKSSRSSSSIFLASGILFFPILIGGWWNMHSPSWMSFPVFHYYRFAILGLILLCFGASLSWELEEIFLVRFLDRKWALPGIFFMALLSFVILDNFSQKPFENWGSTPQSVSISDSKALDLDPNNMGRFLVAEQNRGIGFGMESELSLDYPNFLSNKGLYWESSRNNISLSTYLATLFGPPVVLDYYYSAGLDCKTQTCVFDHFIGDYNLSGMIMGDPTQWNHSDKSTRECYHQMLTQKGTPHFDFISKGQIRENASSYEIYKIQPKLENKNLSNRVVEVVDSKDIATFDRSLPHYQMQTLENTLKACYGQPGIRPNISFLYPDQYKKFQNFVSNKRLGTIEDEKPISFHRIESGHYELEVPSSEGVFFKIKLNYFPGFVLLDEKGTPQPLFDGYPDMIGFGRGKLSLVYRRTSVMYFGYLLSVLFAILSLAGAISRRGPFR